MNILTLDFETYFDDDYTLRKLTTEAYVRGPRFEVHGCGEAEHRTRRKIALCARHRLTIFYHFV